MNNKELYINDQLIDLDEGTSPIQLVYQVNDLAELKDRQAYASNMFQVPATPGNLLKLGLPNDPALIGTTPYRRNRARLLQGGIEIMPNGVAIVRAFKGTIEVQVLSGLIGFFDMMGDKNIRDLDLSDLDHVWDLTTVYQSQSHTEGYIYPVIDYGGLSVDNRQADVRQLRPAVFRRTIIERIVQSAGYTMSGAVLSYDKYLRSIIPFARDKFEHGAGYAEGIKEYQTSARNTGSFPVGAATPGQDIVLNDDAATDPKNQWNGTTFTAQKNMRVNVTFKYTIRQRRLGPHFDDSRIGVSFIVNGTRLAENVTNSVGLAENVFADQVITLTLDMTVGGTIKVNARNPANTSSTLGYIDPGAQISIEPIIEDVTFGSDIQVEATLPDVTQKNFFKDFLQAFGLIVIPDNFNRHITLMNMQEVYENKPNAKQYDLRETKGITFSMGSYAINNHAKYKEDSGVPAGTGDGVMVLDNLTLNDNIDFIESIFAASISVNKLGGLSVTEIRKIEDPTKSLEFKIKTTPRILLDVKQNTPFAFVDATTVINVDSISLPTFNGLSFTELLADNYPEIQRMLNRPVVMDREVLIKETEIASLDWTVPVYDELTASYYYCNKITYLQADVSSIVLVKMP